MEPIAREGKLTLAERRHFAPTSPRLSPQQRADLREAKLSDSRLPETIVQLVASADFQYGIYRWATILIGVENHKVRSLATEHTPGFGLLKGCFQYQVVELLRQLVERGRLVRTEGRYPVLQATPQGERGPLLARKPEYRPADLREATLG